MFQSCSLAEKKWKTFFLYLSNYNSFVSYKQITQILIVGVVIPRNAIIENYNHMQQKNWMTFLTRCKQDVKVFMAL